MISIIAASGPTMAQFTFAKLEDDPRLPFPLQNHRQSGRWTVAFNRKQSKLAEFKKFIYRSGNVGHWIPTDIREVPNYVLEAYIDAIKQVRGSHV